MVSPRKLWRDTVKRSALIRVGVRAGAWPASCEAG